MEDHGMDSSHWKLFGRIPSTSYVNTTNSSAEVATPDNEQIRQNRMSFLNRIENRDASTTAGTNTSTAKEPVSGGS